MDDMEEERYENLNVKHADMNSLKVPRNVDFLFYSIMIHFMKIIQVVSLVT